MQYVLFFLLALFSATHCSADTIWLRNGDRINGTIEFKLNDRLVVSTSYADTISIDWDDVVTLETSNPILIRSDVAGQSQPAILDIAEDGYVICKSCDKKMFPLAAIDALVYPRPLLHDVRTEGKIDLASNYERKDKDVNELKVDAEMRLMHGAWRHSLEGERKYKTENDETKDNNWNATYKLDRFFTPQVYARGTGAYKHDRKSDLIRSRNYGAGIGYLLRDDKIMRADFTLSAMRYILDFEREYTLVDGDTLTVRGQLTIDTPLLAWDFNRLLAGDRLSFYTKGEIAFPDVEHIHLITDSESGLKYHFNSWTFATLKYEFEEIKTRSGNVRNYTHAIGIGAQW